MDTPTKTVLIVEDDHSLRTILSDRLTISNFKVLQAEDGERALVLIDENKPHLVLLDLLLPKVDGFEVLESVRKNADPDIANTRVIVLSNLWSDKDILRAKDLRIDEYYVKSNTNLEDVFQKVQRALSSAAG